jgi:hypothetical protein
MVHVMGSKYRASRAGVGKTRVKGLGGKISRFERERERRRGKKGLNEGVRKENRGPRLDFEVKPLEILYLRCTVDTILMKPKCLKFPGKSNSLRFDTSE